MCRIAQLQLVQSKSTTVLIPAETVAGFFRPLVDVIVANVDEVLRNSRLMNVQCVLLVWLGTRGRWCRVVSAEYDQGLLEGARSLS